MSSKEIRNTFLAYFKARGHHIVPSAPIVVKNDPTLMFTNAGMNQFKDFFLGNKKPQYSRVVDTQKCLRVSGKHNDLEEVGMDTYHHTMFEMLGNWSFGDYFKKEAIESAWNLLTRVFKIDKDSIYVTIFEGNEEDGLDADEEAYDIWSGLVDKERVLKFSKKDNFWEMGDAGPCGPCSEIHVDIRSEEERNKVDGATLVNKDHPQVIEVWNLVFIQYNRDQQGKLSALPQKHVDTGMGFERLCMVLQGKQSNYDTDIFQGIIEKIAKTVGRQYGDNKQTDIAFRVIADHIRAIAFTIADGQLPDREGAGYVVRRILRRAVRYGYSFLDRKEPFLYLLIETLSEIMGDQFPELSKQRDLITKVIKEEEENFLRTLEKGINRLNHFITENPGVKIIPGELAFELFDTYGFPVDLTQLLAREKELDVNMDEFKSSLQQQKDRSRQAAVRDTEDWVVLSKDDVEEFIGYDQLEAEVAITRYRKVKTRDKEYYQLVFNLTPFYAESGGQVGDTGFIESGGEKISIVDTKKENELILHFAQKLPADPAAKFKAVVNRNKRALAANNHTATHLLHEALREILGRHVEQKGSLVHPDYLRFDFSHFQKMTDEELEKIETLVNERIRQNIALDEQRNVPMNQAKEMGALALFGEKYGDVVRVIKFGNSVELCGGTHVQATGEISVFKILSESGVAAGVRRIEAITGPTAVQYFNERLAELKRIAGMIKNKDVVAGVETLVKEKEQLASEIDQLLNQQAGQIKEQLKQQIIKFNGINYISSVVTLNSSEAIKNLSYHLKNEVENLFLVIGADLNGKAHVSVMIDDKLVKDKGLNAGNIIRDLAKEIKGGGGGQAFYATAGGQSPEGLPRLMEKAKQLVENL